MRQNGHQKDGDSEEPPGFCATQELIAHVNRASEEQEERELVALDDAIVGTNSDELRALRAQLVKREQS